MSTEEVNTLKIILLGDQSVGKTSLLNRFVNKKFDENPKPTIDIGVKKGSVYLGVYEEFRMYIFDTAGQERYRSLAKSYYRDANGIILVYDVSEMTSFNVLTGWLDEIKNNCENDAKVVIAGNKSDKPNSKVVVEGQVKAFANLNGYPYLETSALTGKNVEEIFWCLLRQIFSLTKEETNKLTFVKEGGEDDARAREKRSGGVSLEFRRNLEGKINSVGKKKDEDVIQLHSTAPQAKKTGCCRGTVNWVMDKVGM